MFDTELIDFKRLAVSDLSYMHKWLNSDFVKEWYGKKNWTLTEVEDKYIPYINGVRPTQGYLITYDNTPIGFVQTYKIKDYPDYARCVDINENSSGLDIFIGEKDYIHKGLGKHIIRKFLKDIIFSLSDSECCIIGPEPQNVTAIKTYEKAGFRYVKTVEIDGEEEPEYIMRVAKEEIR